MRYDNYKYNIIMFHLVISPATFQGHINNVLRKHLDQFYIAY
jgi:hypothetical protein